MQRSIFYSNKDKQKEKGLYVKERYMMIYIYRFFPFVGLSLAFNMIDISKESREYNK